MLIDRGIKKVWFAHPMEYHCALQRVAILIHGVVQVTLEDIILT